MTIADIRQDDGLPEFALWYTHHRLRRTGQNPSPVTLQGKLVHLRSLMRTAEVTTASELGTLLVDRDRVEHLLNQLHARITPGAVRAYLYSLLAFADYAKVKGWAPYCALTNSDVPPQNPAPAIVVYSAKEVETFISAAKGRDLRWWAFLAFLADSGRRVGEVLSLRWEWFRLNETPAYVELPTNKTHKPQYVPLGKRLVEEVFIPEVMDKLRGEVRTGHRAFMRDARAYPFPWSYNAVYRRMETFCEVTGLPNRGFHNFRHTLITQRLADGVPLQAVAALAGHSSTQTTDRRYNHTDALTFAKWVK